MCFVHDKKPILLLMGPTASGKSALAVSIAQRLGGAILNADAMQCYADLRIVSARPTPAEMAGVPHHLYGIWDARTHGNAALWQRAALAAIAQVQAARQVPMLVGGTGMYLRALTHGLSVVPPISAAIMAQVNALVGQALADALAQHDPLMAAQLQPTDTQRLRRALAVMLQTGRSLQEWQQAQPPAPLAGARLEALVVQIPREILYARINARFDAMMQAGALDEIAALAAQFSEEELQQLRLPILKAHGVPELLGLLNGRLSEAEAIAKAQQNTRNYAKRQLTWIRGQLQGFSPIAYDADAEAAGEIMERLV
jgi:tRNA dimethylallyltransferase